MIIRGLPHVLVRCWAFCTFCPEIITLHSKNLKHSFMNYFIKDTVAYINIKVSLNIGNQITHFTHCSSSYTESEMGLL